MAKYGFGSFVWKFEKFIPLSSKIIDALYHDKEISKPQRVRLVLQDLGPTAIKFGQWMSTRPDVLPMDYIVEFEKLQDRVPTFPYAEVEMIIKQELGGDIATFFEHFSKKVIASGSIAQVHKAKLKDGPTVAVKVQRPKIREIIKTDMEILKDLAKLAGDHISKSEVYDPMEILEEFAYAIDLQLDFLNEAKDMDTFRNNFREIDYVLVPKVFSELTTTRLITMEYLEGVKINDLKAIDEAGFDKQAIQINLYNAYLKQIYLDGFFHGDPHPGNLFVMPRHVIGFTDFGIMGFLDKQAKENIARLFLAVMKKDSREMAEVMFDIGIVKGDINFEHFSSDLDKVLRKYHGVTLKNMRLGDVLRDMVKVMKRHKMRMLPNLALLTVTLISAEGLVISIDPEFDTYEEASPFIKELVSKRMNPLNSFIEFGRNFENYYDVFSKLPRRIDRILKNVEKGDLRIIFKDERLENLNLVIDKASNRLIAGTIISAIILGLSIVTLSGMEPVIFGIPIFETLLVAAWAIGIWLIFSIFRSGRF